MKITNIKSSEEKKTIIVKYAFKNEHTKLAVGMFGEIKVSDNNFINLHCNDRLYKLEVADQLDYELIVNRTERLNIVLGEVTNVFTNEQIQVDILFCSRKINFPAGTISVDEKFIRDIQRKRLDLAKLKQNFSFKICREDYFLIVTQIANKREHQENGDALDVFSIVGDNGKLDIKKENSGKLFASRLSPYQNASCIWLVHGELRIRQASSIERVINKEDIDKIFSSGSAFISQWENYENELGNRELENARKLGVLKINSVKQNGSKYTDIYVEFGNNFAEWNLFSERDLAITTVGEIPEYISTEDFDYQKFCENISIEDLKEEFAVISITKNYITVDTSERTIQHSGYIIYSFYAIDVQARRCKEAIDKMKYGRSQIPYLGLLFDETNNEINAQLSKRKKKSNHKALSAVVKDKIFSSSPTTNQIEAIEIALNTPDICLIQGPPGTGKTTVITAIIERLNEISDHRSGANGEILVTAFQHDAVENAIAKLNKNGLNGLPTFKIGSRYDEREQAEKKNEVELYRWIEDITNSVRDKVPELKDVEGIKKLEQLFEIYREVPSEVNHAGLLCLLLSFCSSNDNELINELIKENDGNNLGTAKGTMRLLRALRTTAIAYDDDGAKIAEDILFELDNILSEQNKAIIEEAARIDSSKDASIEFLYKIREAKKHLLIENAPKSVYKRPKLNQQTVEIYNRVIGEIKNDQLKVVEKANNKQLIILMNFLDKLESNQTNIYNILRQYYQVTYASSIQQSAGSQLKKLKGLRKGDSRDLSYDTVIVDEAARSAPSDLLIAMVQAKGRIILVGDHRQLPHIVDDEIVSKIGENGENAEEVNKAIYSDSLFKRLFERMKALERIDGIKRTVTLNKQYRTHPLLGEFCSNNFYKKYSEDEAYSSPLPASIFDQNLSAIAHKAFVWIEVPHSVGKEKKEIGRGVTREIEADTIKNYISKWLSEDDKLTFGVITFYRRQADRLEDILKDEHKKYNVDGIERLRVGTVDKFQGMEFDIVVLSTVRSPNIDSIKSELDSEDTLVVNRRIGQTLGFIVVENRLCVSMSRQKKTLVIVGDSGLFAHDKLSGAIPAIKDFYKHCSGESGVVIPWKK
jgi:superfamily I DNA and/or RNA helicase